MRIHETTNQHTPPARSSDEATSSGLAIAQEVGDAFGRAVDHMVHEVAKGGDEIAAGEYLVAFAYEAPEGLYHWVGNELEWREPAGENLHLEVAVRDGRDGRFVPSLNVTATLVDSSGQATNPQPLPFLWHPSLYHYGANIRIPGADVYDIIVAIAPPTFSRHDRVNGKRFTTKVTAQFRSVRLTPLEPD
jgi:hypothetical protein